jgi:hypothetical protein
MGSSRSGRWSLLPSPLLTLFPLSSHLKGMCFYLGCLLDYFAQVQIITPVGTNWCLGDWVLSHRTMEWEIWIAADEDVKDQRWLRQLFPYGGASCLMFPGSHHLYFRRGCGFCLPFLAAESPEIYRIILWRLLLLALGRGWMAGLSSAGMSLKRCASVHHAPPPCPGQARVPDKWEDLAQEAFVWSLKTLQGWWH